MCCSVTRSLVYVCLNGYDGLQMFKHCQYTDNKSPEFSKGRQLSKKAMKASAQINIQAAKTILQR